MSITESKDSILSQYISSKLIEVNEDFKLEDSSIIDRYILKRSSKLLSGNISILEILE